MSAKGNKLNEKSNVQKVVGKSPYSTNMLSSSSKSSSKLHSHPVKSNGSSIFDQRYRSKVTASPNLGTKNNLNSLDGVANSGQKSSQRSSRISIETQCNTTTPQSSSSKTVRTQRYRVSVEGSSQNGTPNASKSVNISISGRKSAGATPSYRRSLSARKSASKSLLVSACKNSAASSSNTPVVNGLRHFTNGTPTVPLNLDSLKKLDIPSLSGRLLNSEVNESSTVSVGVRVRPLNERELRNPNIRNIVKMEGNDVIIQCENESILKFSYDHCLSFIDSSHQNYATQSVVYQTMAKPLLEHAYEGYNVCLFAYGQTGSGKSYSIMGESCNNYGGETSDISSDGVIPRFCRELFDKADEIHNSKDSKCRVTAEISYIEIYNEKIFDLIGAPNISDEVCWNSSTNNEERREPLKIREHPLHGPYVVGASSPVVTSYEDLQTWLMLGNKQRSVAATGMNDKSSRSHSVFTIRLSQTQTELIAGEEMEHTKMSVINLVDLAGSERVAMSYSEGDRLKEGICINMSLLTLGKVIMALAESGEKPKTFIPYRESTLTFLLKESLGGNSKTSMIATISPSNIHQEETLSTLRYAQHARKIVNWNHINEDQSYVQIIKALQEEVERLHSIKLNPKDLFGEDLKNEKSGSNGEVQESDKDEQRLEEQRIIEEKEREIELLKRRLKSAEEEFKNHTKHWRNKIIESEKKKEEALAACKMRGLALKLEQNRPILVNLCEDQQLSETLFYNLKNGSTSFGASHADVTLSGLGQDGIHCSVMHEGDELFLYPVQESKTYVNGILVQGKTKIYHNDRIALGGVYFFRVFYSESGSSPLPDLGSDLRKHTPKFDFYYAKEELLKEQEERIRREMREQFEASRADILKEVDEKRMEIKLHEKSMKENLDFLSEELEEERNMKIESEKALAVLESDKKYLEERLHSLQTQDSPTLSDLSCSFASPDFDNFYKQVEELFDVTESHTREAKNDFDSSDVEVCFKITKATHLCENLGKPYRFEQQTVLGNTGFEMKTVVHDLNHNLYSYLTSSQLDDILTVLEDIRAGTQDNDVLFETNLEWEKFENFSKIRYLNDKILDASKNNLNASCLNSSLNSSVLNASLRRLSIGHRRSSLQKSSLNLSVSKPLDVPQVPNHVVVAKTLSLTLLNRTAPSYQVPIFIEAQLNLMQLYQSAEEFLNMYQEMESSLSTVNESDFSCKLTHLAMLAQLVEVALNRVGSLNLLNDDFEKGAEIQASLGSFSRRIVQVVIRALQGVENEVESIVDQETTKLLKIVAETTKNLAFLNVIARSDFPRGSDLSKCFRICESYLQGLANCLVWLIRNVADFLTASSSQLKELYTNSGSPKDCDVLNFAFLSFNSLTDFMKLFSQLEVLHDVNESLNQKEVKKQSNRFITRVAKSSENINQMHSSLVQLAREVKNVHIGIVHVDVLHETIQNLQEALGELVDDAGIGVAFKKNLSRKDSTSTEDSVELFLEDLHNAAMATFQQIKLLKNAIPQTQETSKTNSILDISCSLLQRFETPLRSAMKNGEHTQDGKKVRFNVSLSPLVFDSSEII